MMKIDGKCIKPCQAQGLKLIIPERTDESISDLIKFIACEVVTLKKSGSKSSNVYFFNVEILICRT